MSTWLPFRQIPFVLQPAERLRMKSKIRAFADELAPHRTFRVAFALMPFHGSDREVGWTALEADRAANRPVTYVTAPIDFREIARHFPQNNNASQGHVLEFGPVRVVSWPIDLPNRLLPIGYIRFLIWVISLQVYLAIRTYRIKGVRVHFLTYTQLATPIVLPKRIEVFLGPVGIIPRMPAAAPVSKKLVRKSRIMWRLIMPLIQLTNRRKAVRTAVVHASLLPELPNTTKHTVLSALNIDYLEPPSSEPLEHDSKIDAIVVARDVAFKNLDIVKGAFAEAAARYGLNCLVINAGQPKELHRLRGGVRELGRQDRNGVSEHLRSSRIHVMLSVELGGYINLEAASLGVPTLCLDGYGASAMLKPSPPFLLRLGELHPAYVADRMAKLLSDQALLRHEALAQAEHASEFIRINREMFDRWLDESA